MAFSSLRLRRALTLSSSLLRNQNPFSTITSSSVLQSPISSSSTSNVVQNPRDHMRIQSLSFHSSLPFSSSRPSSYNEGDKISPDTILFEGCDYNHWLITMDFPKDPKPTPEEMVETYVQTLAKVVGGVEEAKKRMYACSTTTYTGFQAVMTEEMSEKFRGLPGVVFILPDSYIDPVNKEYGGDKYINGTIIPRPPPVQYGRQGRYGDRNRNYERPRNDRPRDPMPMHQGNQPYDCQGPMQLNHGTQQNYARQQNYGPPEQGQQRESVPMGGRENYGPPGQGERRDSMPMGGRENYGPPGQGERRDSMPMGGRENYGPKGQEERRDSMPMGGRDYAPGGRESYPGERRDSMPSYQRDYNPGNQGNYPPQEQRDVTQGYRRDYPPAEHRDRGVPPPSSGGYGQGADSGYRQGYPGPGEAHRFPPVQQNGTQEGPGSYMPMGQDMNGQDRY